jgi:F-type H+-transporting ATPase subunit b
MPLAATSVAVLVGAPVVDIDGTFFVQGGMFLLLFVVLWPLLFKPWLATQQRRKDAIFGAHARAKDLRHDADALLVEHEQKLTAARDRANELRASVRRDEEAAQAKKLAEARTAATTQAESARKRIAQQAETARAALAGRVDELAKDIVARLLGRAS